MEIYGNHDIPLGRFLEEYCFRQAYKCPSKSCATPMLRHIRRFVHDGGCVQVKSKTLVDCNRNETKISSGDTETAGEPNSRRGQLDSDVELVCGVQASVAGGAAVCGHLDAVVGQVP